MPRYARDCDPTLGAAIAHIDREVDPEPVLERVTLGRPLTAAERRLIAEARSDAAKQVTHG